MDDIIHLLPDTVANQIAAGEVVQRPASVIKELMENALDAGATRIQVWVQEGGKTLVQVIDNGKGMSETDARLAFERHATSKISAAADLYNLTTMGFRGEALASIAAVAQVELRTRRPMDEVGTSLEIFGSKIERQEPVACPVGSNFAVKNLFYNVPARRKFLKSTQTELTNIVQEFERIALVYPDIEFSLNHNGSDLYKLPATSLRARIVDVMGKKIDPSLLPVSGETSIVKISGYVAAPEFAKKRGANQYFFVNGRYMRHPYFHSAVMQPYDNLIPAGEHPSYFIYLAVDPASIDVNVHPTKTEIKFNEEREIWQVLQAVVREALGKYANVPTIDFDTADRPDIPAVGIGGGYTPGQPRPTYNPFTDPNRTHRPRANSEWEKLYDGVQSFEGPHPAAGQGSLVNSQERYIVDNLVNMGGLAPQLDPQQNLFPDSENPVLDLHEEDIDTLPAFQYKGRYIVAPTTAGLLVIDQHRAHTCVLYEDFLRRLENHTHASQRLLFPELLQFSQKECLVIESIQEELETLGFDLTSLGGGSYSLAGVPANAESNQPAQLLHDLIYASMELGANLKQQINHTMALVMAQSASIVYGQVLTQDEIHTLIRQLYQQKMPLRSPSGKRVYDLIPVRNIEKMF